MAYCNNQQYYYMGNRRRGLAIVINNENYLPQSGIQSRKGSHIDVARIQDMCDYLGFDVAYSQDLTANEMTKFIEEKVKKYDFRGSDCALLCILSHGKEGQGGSHDDCIISVDGTLTNLNILREPLQKDCDLKGKPKLVILQACRGTGRGTTNNLASEKENTVYNRLSDTDGCSETTQRCEKTLNVTLPDTLQVDSNATDHVLLPQESEEADFLTMFACTPGTMAFRNVAAGSIFIERLCDEIKLNCYCTEFQHLLLTVTDKVVQWRHISWWGKQSQFRQCSTLTSQLRKKLFFEPKIEITCLPNERRLQLKNYANHPVPLRDFIIKMSARNCDQSRIKLHFVYISS